VAPLPCETVDRKLNWLLCYLECLFKIYFTIVFIISRPTHPISVTRWSIVIRKIVITYSGDGRLGHYGGLNMLLRWKK